VAAILVRSHWTWGTWKAVTIVVRGLNRSGPPPRLVLINRGDLTEYSC
jgi:hypothetical protein